MNTYGEAPDTVSVSTTTLPFVELPGVCKFASNDGNRYVNVLVSTTVATRVEILYACGDTPLIFIGVSVVSLCAFLVTTVTTLLRSVPSPA